MKRFFRHHGFALLFFTVLPAIWWWPLLAGYLPDFQDTIAALYPYRKAAAGQLRQGILPLWNPHIFSGLPLAANPQIAAWYPPQAVFYLMPNPLGNGLVVLLHYILGGLGMYALVRWLAGRPSAAIFAGFTFQFSAMLASRIALTPHVYTTIWIPWMLLGVEWSLARPGWRPNRGAQAVAAFFALQVLAGAPQITFYTALALPIYWLWRGWQRHGAWREGLLQPLARGAAAAALALLLSAIQIVPTLEFLRHTERAALDVESLQEQALHGGYLLSALVGYTGNPIEDTDTVNALGWGALVLALLALFSSKTRRPALVLLALGALSYLLAVAVLVPAWSKLLPLYQSFHAPRRALVLWSVAGSVMAGLGAAGLHDWIIGKGRTKLLYYLLLVVAASGTFWLLGRVDRAFTGTERFQPGPQYVETIGRDRFLAVDPSLRYSYDPRRPDFGLSMMPDLACWFGYYDAQGYDPLVPERYGMVRRWASMRTGFLLPRHGVLLTDPASPALRLLNIQFLVGRYDIYDPSRVIPEKGFDPAWMEGQVERVAEHPRWPLYRYTDERPLAWAVSEIRAANDAAYALQGIAREPDPFRVAYTEEPIQANLGPPPEVTVSYDRESDLLVRLDPAPQSDAFICASVNWMPGWRVITEAGETLPAYPVNGFQVGTLVPPGTGEFRLEYRPASFRWGWMLSALGLLVFATLAWRNKSENSD